MSKYKLFNDPIYGLISFQHDILYRVIDSYAFQRLRRISQMGLSSMVYPGATHTRFHHALGALRLTDDALKVLIEKGVEISEDEIIATSLAILCHDIGHGPFSHALEKKLIYESHESLSVKIMKILGNELNYDFTQAIAILQGQYPKKFLHQLISSQLDMDRMDYLSRDSFYSGVSEGVIGYDRIIKMLNVSEGGLVVEEKGVYSVEKFLTARHIMYWQVYLHKTSLSAELMLSSIIDRSKMLLSIGQEVFGSSYLLRILNSEYQNPEEQLSIFLELDDTDVLMLVKENQKNSDPVLKFLCESLLKRRIFNVFLHENSVKPNLISKEKLFILQNLSISEEELSYLHYTGSVSNKIYDSSNDEIKILMKSGDLKELSELIPHIMRLDNIEKNYFIFAKF